MGTSSMYGGPGGGTPQENPLLPPDFDPNSPDQPDPSPDPEDQNYNDGNEDDRSPNQESEIQTTWQSAKTSMSKFSSGTAGSAGSVISTYVKAHGGGKNASRSMPSGTRTAVRLGNFLNSVASSSFREVIESYTIDYQGKSATEILTQLIEVIAPAPITREDSVARKALIITMEQVYEMVEQSEMDIMDMDANGLNFIVPCYVKSFIYERLLNDLGSRIESSNITTDRAIELETELRDYIDSKVDVVFTGRDFSGSTFTTELVESIFNQCYTAMEIMI